MSEYKFYYPDGTEFGSKDDPDKRDVPPIQKFIDYYNKSYYINYGEKITYKSNSGKCCTIGQNSCYAENLIEKILNKSPEDFDFSDVVLILAWKMGKIKHSEFENKLVLHKDWKDVLKEYNEEKGFYNRTDNKVKRYNFYIYFEEIAEYIKAKGNDLNKLIGNDQTEIALDEIKNDFISNSWKGFGAVYLITLLYFISNKQNPGKCPIYDQFAMKALLAIKSEKNPNENNIINSDDFIALPSKDNKKFGNKTKEILNKYICLLNKIFGSDWKKDRDIDRALWVYGHLFQSQQKSDC